MFLITNGADIHSAPRYISGSILQVNGNEETETRKGLDSSSFEELKTPKTVEEILAEAEQNPFGDESDGDNPFGDNDSNNPFGNDSPRQSRASSSTSSQSSKNYSIS